MPSLTRLKFVSLHWDFPIINTALVQALQDLQFKLCEQKTQVSNTKDGWRFRKDVNIKTQDD